MKQKRNTKRNINSAETVGILLKMRGNARASPSFVLMVHHKQARIVQLHDDVMLLQLPESLSLLFSYAN